jgi:hypothetical protein
VLVAAAQMLEGGAPVNASVEMQGALPIESAATTTLVVELRSASSAAGACNVSIYRQSSGAVAATFRFVWMARDRPRIADFSPKSEFIYGGTALAVALDFPPQGLSCVNLTCLLGAAGPIPRCVSVAYGTASGTAGAPQRAVATFILPAAAGAGAAQPTLYLGLADAEIGEKLALPFPANFTSRAPPAPAVTRASPSSAAANAAGTAVAITVTGFPPVAAAADIIASFEWLALSSSSPVTAAAVIDGPPEWIDGTAGAALQAFRFTLRTPPLPAAALAGIVAALRVSHVRFSSLWAVVPFLFVDSSQPQVLRPTRFLLHTETIH